ncbi:hypothetical protein P22_2932 [Propionispora sp. 2/2-37]|uniref:methylglyoxal synthase n=1 Tax=Propionispora sp. 2/2-37 TaxID=1677858 RepID=UPI0006BB82E1|nr:methylglyoxal synthase [Propionispora sp. 2/2-37]CUH96821.1 hypothetical protein P22_2932 [Propionispora sp. 2/2-37]
MSQFKLEKQKRIALIAHDNRKQDLVSWAMKRKQLLSNHFLCGTGTTSAMISQHTGLSVKAYQSGPLGGDQQIGACIVANEVNFMVFFWDPLAAQPHDPDVKALLRIAVLYDVPVAMNQSSADFFLTSSLMEEEYERNVLDFSQLKKRTF